MRRVRLTYNDAVQPTACAVGSQVTATGALAHAATDGWRYAHGPSNRGILWATERSAHGHAATRCS